jgi:hypothetical protein
MIALLVASAIHLAMLQASIAAPTGAFRSCLHDAATKAKSEKVPGNAIEAYLKNACSGQMSSLKAAIISFRMKNGMSHKEAAGDADMTVDDYVATPADNYKFMADLDAKSAEPPKPPAPTPAAAPVTPPAQPPKP